MSSNTLTEKELNDLLKHALAGSSQDHRYKRINGLEELQKRIKSDSIQNKDAFLDILFEMAITHGDAKPEKSLIISSLYLFIKKDDALYEGILNRLKRQEGQLFIVFAELVLKLDYKKKKMAIKPLLDFVVNRDDLTSIGVNEVYSHLVALGNQSLSNDIVKEASSYLGSIRLCSVLFSVRLCSEFADQSLLPQMLNVLDKSMAGYFNAHHSQIERELCNYFRRIKHQDSFSHLVRLIKLRLHENPIDKSETLSEVLNANPHLMDDVLDALHVAKKNKELVNALLYALKKVEKPPIAQKLLRNIHIKYWWENPTSYYVRTILIKGGEASKPVLLEMLRDPEKYEYALECLKEIGFSSEDLSTVFPKSPILQIYEFFYSQNENKKTPADLNTLWIQKDKLGENIRGTTNKLEHLLIHLLSSFNFVTLNLAPIKFESIDIIGFYPETLDLLIIGCTTGVLKDDLAKMDAAVNKMETEMPDIFRLCNVTPVIACSKNAAISPSDAKYSRAQKIVILEDFDIEKLLEMLNTNREPRQVLAYLEKCKLKYEDHQIGY